ncbi:MAG: aldolase/citrate lyase family protein [Chloroflexota bacterium]|nr:aldolase/citrate lyase family protein [Chloroflexota bacterium]
MRINKMLDRIRAGQRAYGCDISFVSSTLVELIGRSGFDYVQFDGEHGPFTPDTLEDLCRVSDMAGLTPIARVPDIEDSTILRCLDRGVMGIMGPHITTPERAEQLSKACRYAPLGKRSFGSSRGAYFGDFESGTEYMEHTNNEIVVIAQLEDASVLENIDDILAVDGIDIYASGRQDIAQSMGIPGQPEHPKVLEFEEQIAQSVRAAGKISFKDAYVLARSTDLFLNSARAFMRENSDS